MTAARFDSPQTILTGGGSRKEAAALLSALHAHHSLIVVDPYFLTADFVTEIRSNLDRNGIANDVFGDLQPDLTDENVGAGENGFGVVWEVWLVVIGWGSVRD